YEIFLLTSAKINIMKRLTNFLILFSLFIVQTSFSQWCNDPDAWNYQLTGDTSCVYLIDCEPNEVNRLFSIGFSPPMPQGDVYIISLDELDTLAHANYNYSGWGWEYKIIQACMEESTCYYMDFYPADTLLGPPYVTRYYPTSTEDHGIFIASPGARDYYRMFVAAEDSTCGILGCTDITAMNYWPYATVNYGCEYCEDKPVLLTPDIILDNITLNCHIPQYGAYMLI